MAEYIDREKVMAEINRIGGHNLCGWDTIGVKALIDRQPTEDVVPRSEYDAVVSAVDNSTKEFLKLHDAYQSQKRKLDEYKKFIGEIRVTGENHAVIIDTEHTEYIDKRVAEGFKNMAVKQAKQEVAREILGNLSSHTSIGIRHLKELMAECDNAENKAWLEGKISELCNLEKIISEFEKKYIGE
jgi:hypothetical protein